MGKARLDPLNTAHFHCRACGFRFESEPETIEDAVDLDHPFVYMATCPNCVASAEQAAWERNLLKAHAHATGPKTEAGKAASASNLDGHPTQEEAKLTRFNAIKHGLYARTANYFPARPGKYMRCENCEHLASLACMAPPRACLKRHELLLRNQIAFESKDPSLMLQIRSDTQAALQAIIDDMILAIAQDGGPRIKDVVWYHDKDGDFRLAQWIDEQGKLRQLYELKAHPLLKHLMDFIQKNAMTLADMGMTPKAVDDNETMQGFLGQACDKDDAREYQQKTIDALDRLQRLIGNSYSHQRDPVTLEGRADVVQSD